jgi:hypothetical protein
VIDSRGWWVRTNVGWWYGGSSPHQPFPLVVGPVAADGTEHVAAHDRRAQAYLTRSGEAIINALVAALLTEHLAEGPSGKRPVMERLAAHTQRVVETLCGSRGVAIKGDAEVVDAKLRHWQPFRSAQFPDASHMLQRVQAASKVGLRSFRQARFLGGAAVTYEKDPRVDAYIDALPEWQQQICQQVRDLVHAVDREVVETIKRRVQPYFVLEGNICALLAAKDHVNVFLYDGAIVPDPEGIITGGHDNKAARTVAVRQNETINNRALGEMFRQIIANNRAGGWRKIKQEGR